MQDPTITIDIHTSNQTHEMLKKICTDNDLTLTDFFRKSVALMQVSLKHKKLGNRLIVVDNNNNQISEILGI